MKPTSRPFLLLCSAGALALASASDAAGVTYGQHLVDVTLAYHPELSILAMHATPPGGKTNVIVASNIGRNGKPAA